MKTVYYLLILLLSLGVAYDTNVDRYMVSIVKLNETPEHIDQTIVGEGDVEFSIVEIEGEEFISPYSGDLYATRFIENSPDLWNGDSALFRLDIPLEVGYYELTVTSRGIADYDTIPGLDTLYSKSVNAWYIQAEVPSNLGDGKLKRERKKTGLENVFPNPFNPVTTINFYLERPADVKIVLRDIRGAVVRVIARGKYSAGYHSIRYDLSGAATGTYIITMIAGDYVKNIKAIFLK